MKAARINDYGHADAVRITEIDAPKPAADQVLIEVYAASLNPWDTIVREGYLRDVMPLEFPLTLGGDMAGVVVGVGSEITDFKPGDRVYGSVNNGAEASGAFAEYAVGTVKHLAPASQSIDFKIAAAAALTGCSAIQALQEHLQLQAGQKILIHGGAGGIGTVAIQLAKHLGAYVATTATGEGLAYVKELGADEVIDYKTQRFDELFHDFDAVYDTIGGETYKRSFQVLKPGGKIVSMKEMQPDEDLVKRYDVESIGQQTHTTSRLLNVLAGLMNDGIVKIHVDKVFPLDQVSEAFQALEGGDVKGKVVLAIKD
jgi:alcohol dehydrogenase